MKYIWNHHPANKKEKNMLRDDDFADGWMFWSFLQIPFARGVDVVSSRVSRKLVSQQPANTKRGGKFFSTLISR